MIPLELPNHPNWNRHILALMLDLALKAELPVPNAVILNLAISRQVLNSLGTNPPELLVMLRKNPRFFGQPVGEVAAMVKTLEDPHDRILIAVILEMSRLLAQMSDSRQGGMSLEPAEDAYIAEIRDCLVGNPPADPLRSPKNADGGKLVEWASRWDDSMAESAFELLSSMQSLHEAEWRTGSGILDKATDLASIPKVEVPSCDQGVLVLPQSWETKSFWFIGDVHGDLPALEAALRKTGCTGNRIPDDVVVICLGDYGDRGNGTLGVWLRLAGLKTGNPSRIFLLRGNHEETVEVSLTRKDTGKELSTAWHVPSTTHSENLMSLAFLLGGSVQNVAAVFSLLPNVIVVPGKVLVIHGCLPPCWKPMDGWTFGEDEKRELAVSSVADLRKPKLAPILRWADYSETRGTLYAWAAYGSGYRVTTDPDALDQHRGVFGDFRLIHGHTHPHEGARHEDGGKVLALNTSRQTSPKQAVANLKNGELTVHMLEFDNPMEKS